MGDEPRLLPVLVLVKDLIFSSKIAATARAAGIEVKVVRDAAKLIGEAGDHLIADLNQEGAIEAAASWGQQTGRPVIGFVSHVDTAVINQARQSGIDRVLPRSRFVQMLPELLAPTTI